MTKTEILRSVLTYVESLEGAERDLVHKAIDHNVYYDSDTLPAFILSDLCLDLKRDIAAENAKSSGKGKALASALKVIKNAPRDDMRGACIVDGIQYVCDGFHALRFLSPLDLPSVPNFGFDLPKLFRDTSNSNPDDLDLPSVPDLKTYIKVTTAETKALHGGRMPKDAPRVTYDFGDGLPVVAADYLLDILEALPDATCRFNRNNLVAPLYFSCADGDAILCPIRRKP